MVTKEIKMLHRRGHSITEGTQKWNELYPILKIMKRILTKSTIKNKQWVESNGKKANALLNLNSMFRILNKLWYTK